MVEPRGVYGQVEHVVRPCIQLVTYSTVQRLHKVHPQIVCVSCFAVLVQHGVILGVVHRLPPTATPSNPLQLKGEERTQGPAYLFLAHPRTVHRSDHCVLPRVILIAGEIILFRLSSSLHDEGWRKMRQDHE